MCDLDAEKPNRIMTRDAAGKVRRKRNFAAADEMPRNRSGAVFPGRYPRQFRHIGTEAGLFLKKAF
jgi:hypothetical protein